MPGPNAPRLGPPGHAAAVTANSICRLLMWQTDRQTMWLMMTSAVCGTRGHSNQTAHSACAVSLLITDLAFCEKTRFHAVCYTSIIYRRSARWQKRRTTHTTTALSVCLQSVWPVQTIWKRKTLNESLSQRPLLREANLWPAVLCHLRCSAFCDCHEQSETVLVLGIYQLTDSLLSY